MNKTNKKIWSVLACVLVLSALAFAQAGRGKGRLTGLVLNEKGDPIAKAAVKLEYEKGGLKEETVSNAKGEWSFISLGTGNVMLSASAEGFLDGVAQAYVQQLEKNPPVKIVLRDDKERKARVKDEASMEELERGNQLYNERKFDEALEIFNKFAAINPNVYQIYFNIGDVYREKGEFDKANEQYAIAQAKAKEKADIVMQAKALAAFGEVYLRQEKFKEAQEYFTQSIALNPKDEILAYNVAEIFFGRNQTDKAIEYYKLAIQIKPEWSEPYLKMGYAYLNKGDMKLAIDSLNEFLKRDPESPQAPVVKSLIESLTKTK
ncbi:MAG TPA: tetratricopeptide repeat protein [Acidobacteriota bacterium]